ncbi:MAG TPA: shikimate dehydrogenase [Anaerolineae bacterium]|nr:shikimate dehydrogenase [Anaerolineae bacterium]HQH38484.1 shikimate dehydrogenase [Anaerolineae bacterium]
MSFVINGRTQLVGVIGWPVEHSLSPAMHNAALTALGLNWCYVAMPVRPGEVVTAVHGLAALGFRGCNVTVPHKQAVMAALDSVTPEAKALGAVNTLVFTRTAEGASHIAGHNTDVAGFIGALRAGGFEPAGRRIMVVGAGGAARGVVYGLMEAGAASITILNRTAERAQILIADLAQRRKDIESRKSVQQRMTNHESRLMNEESLTALPLTDETLVESARQADLLVHTTTVGMWPEVEGCIWPAGTPIPAALTVYDLVYNPLETRLLRLARQSGARAIAGVGMLARQGALALDLWTAQALDVNEIAALMQREVVSS